MGGGYKKYDTVKVNGRNRIRFVKANSKSKNPILYIKSDNEYITYKSFLRKRKIRGGAIKEIDVTNSTYKEVYDKYSNDIYEGRKYLVIRIKDDNDKIIEKKIEIGELKYIWFLWAGHQEEGFLDLLKMGQHDVINEDEKKKIIQIIVRYNKDDEDVTNMSYDDVHKQYSNDIYEGRKYLVIRIKDDNDKIIEKKIEIGELKYIWFLWAGHQEEGFLDLLKMGQHDVINEDEKKKIIQIIVRYNKDDISK